MAATHHYYAHLESSSNEKRRTGNVSVNKGHCWPDMIFLVK